MARQRRAAPGLSWTKPLEIAGVAPLFETADIVGHNDWTPENIIVVNRRPVGIIDFDLAGPTTRLLDVVNAVMWWAHRARHDGGGWARMWDDGVGDVIRRSIAWLQRERATLETRLFDTG